MYHECCYIRTCILISLTFEFNFIRPFKRVIQAIWLVIVMNLDAILISFFPTVKLAF